MAEPRFLCGYAHLQCLVHAFNFQAASSGGGFDVTQCDIKNSVNDRSFIRYLASRGNVRAGTEDVRAGATCMAALLGSRMDYEGGHCALQFAGLS